ncbi:CLUMA_CG014749, isoform A [Clunio marinus]|uniref:CLUMA_CG014749, isoform A n=1 Tax=Clunio marinus TaxID=568069 RepID=A0A1J1IN25_9DIPT|nr:CLUMA_CG014749, isoform A [Clunio marinus]
MNESTEMEIDSNWMELYESTIFDTNVMKLKYYDIYSDHRYYLHGSDVKLCDLLKLFVNEKQRFDTCLLRNERREMKIANLLYKVLQEDLNF